MVLNFLSRIFVQNLRPPLPPKSLNDVVLLLMTPYPLLPTIPHFTDNQNRTISTKICERDNLAKNQKISFIVVPSVEDSANLRLLGLYLEEMVQFAQLTAAFVGENSEGSITEVLWNFECSSSLALNEDYFLIVLQKFLINL